MKSPKIINCILIIFLFLTLSPRCDIYAQKSTSLEDRLLKLETEVTKLDAQKENYDFIKNETKEYRSFIETERHNFQTYIDNLLKFAGFLIILFLGFLGFLSIRTVNDLKPILESYIKDKVDKSVDNNLEKVNERIDALTFLVDREILYKNSGVLIAGDTNDFKSMEEEISILENYINKQCVKTVEVDEVGKKINTFNPSIIVLCNKNGNKGKEDLECIVNTLNNSQKSIPLIIYTYCQPQLSGELKKIADSYFWTTYANNPVTLVGNIFTLAHSFTKGRSC